MDTIVLLLVLYGIYKKFKRKGGVKKPQRTLNEAARKRAERAIRMHEEVKRRRAEEQLTMESAVTASAFGEGQSNAAPVYLEGESALDAHREYRGSMNADSSEGECICDPELEHERMALADQDSVYAGEIGRGLPLDLSPSGIYQGIVMREILARPGERLRRR